MVVDIFDIVEQIKDKYALTKEETNSLNQIISLANKSKNNLKQMQDERNALRSLRLKGYKLSDAQNEKADRGIDIISP